MKRIENFIYENFDKLLSIRLLALVYLIVFVIIILIGSYYESKRNDAAYRYIKELEEYVEANGGLMDTIGGGDAHTDWYNY